MLNPRTDHTSIRGNSVWMESGASVIWVGEREQQGEREVGSASIHKVGQEHVQAVQFGGKCRSFSNGNIHVK
jgi:hypothetical protein